MYLTDYYGTVNTTDFTTSVAATVLPGYSCGGGGHIGYLSGTTTVVATAGKVSFDTLSAYCYPSTLFYLPSPPSPFFSQPLMRR